MIPKFIQVTDIWDRDIYIHLGNILGIAKNENDTWVITLRQGMTIGESKDANRIALSDKEWRSFSMRLAGESAFL